MVQMWVSVRTGNLREMKKKYGDGIEARSDTGFRVGKKWPGKLSVVPSKDLCFLSCIQHLVSTQGPMKSCGIFIFYFLY